MSDHYDDGLDHQPDPLEPGYERSYDRQDRPARPPRKKRRPARVHYRIYDRDPLPLHIIAEMDEEFARDLGEFLLEVDTPDKRFKSFGHNLCNQVDGIDE